MDFSFDVFVSYAHADAKFARELVEWIRISGFHVWFDEEQLVPGSRFRAGLQQGLRESRHMIALLTESYSTRPWTQRELDLFDVSADHTERRILALKVGDLDLGPLDQVFQVHQIIHWQRRIFESESFWLLYCGLTNQRPGPRTEWSKNGQQLIKKRSDAVCYDPNLGILRAQRPSIVDTASDSGPTKIIELVDRCLRASSPEWQESFSTLREKLKEPQADGTIRDILLNSWALGMAERSAVISLALIPQWYGPDGVWPFVDLGTQNIAHWLMSVLQLTHPQAASEIWFSWVVSERAWPLLPLAASRVPEGSVRKHFENVSTLALNETRFKKVEEDYDYGLMITPWNHFHLCWLALKLKDQDSALAHAEALCEAALRSERRAARFLVRLSNWTCFEPLRSNPDLIARIDSARTALGLEETSASEERKRRVEMIWPFVMETMAEAT